MKTGSVVNSGSQKKDVQEAIGSGKTTHNHHETEIISFSWMKAEEDVDKLTLRAATEEAVAQSMCLPIIMIGVDAGVALIDQGATRPVMQQSAYERIKDHMSLYTLLKKQQQPVSRTSYCVAVDKHWKDIVCKLVLDKSSIASHYSCVDTRCSGARTTNIIGTVNQHITLSAQQERYLLKHILVLIHQHSPDTHRFTGDETMQHGVAGSRWMMSLGRKVRSAIDGNGIARVNAFIPVKMFNASGTAVHSTHVPLRTINVIGVLVNQHITLSIKRKSYLLDYILAHEHLYDTHQDTSDVKVQDSIRVCHMMTQLGHNERPAKEGKDVATLFATFIPSTVRKALHSISEDQSGPSPHSSDEAEIDETDEECKYPELADDDGEPVTLNQTSVQHGDSDETSTWGATCLTSVDCVILW